ncbi:MAG: SGNH/GDSL hydrolase family protein [Acidobacteria bacterium]|nr:SGNH/GDSL hydrolase family protein [Acidobacteriota bacterium]
MKYTASFMGLTRRLSLCLMAAGMVFGQAPNPAVAPITETPGLPRVLLIGDSISMGYTLPVREMLTGKANVLRIPTNAAFTRFSLEHIEEWLGSGRWDVIHMNWGLHDLKIMEGGKHQVGIEEYEKNLEALVGRLKKTRAKLIYATTTPVPEGKVSPPRNPADVAKFNAVAVAVMQRNGVTVNDLYEAVLPKLGELQTPVNVHYKPEGYRFLGELVAAFILRALP